MNTNAELAGEREMLRIYIADISRYPLLNRDDEARLSAAIQAGAAASAALSGECDLPAWEQRNLRKTRHRGQEAERTLVESNLRLVVSIAKHYKTSGVSLMDLIQEGNLGLMQAVERFDGSLGFRFSTYATWWIRRAVERGIGNTKRTIRLPLPAGRQLAHIQAARASLSTELGRSATDAEIADAAGVSAGRVAALAHCESRPLSLSAPISESGGTLSDVLTDDASDSPFDAAVVATLPGVIDRALARLPIREREIISLRFGLGGSESRTCAEVARTYGLSAERIRQLERQAITRLRAAMCGSEDRELLSA